MEPWSSLSKYKNMGGGHTHADDPAHVCLKAMQDMFIPSFGERVYNEAEAEN